MSATLFPTTAPTGAPNEDTNSGELGIRGGFPKLSSGRRRSLQLQVNASQGRDPKKMKLHQFDDIPPSTVQDGVISASKTPVFDKGRKVEIVISKVHDVRLFFDDVSDVSKVPDYEMPGYLKRALKGRMTSEETLRNAVYTNLMDDHGIDFPESSIKQVKGMTKVLLRATGKKGRVYKETYLASLLAEYGETRGHKSDNMRRIMKGFPVTTTSKPDLAPLDSKDEADIQIRFGEFKNANNYNTTMACTQCTMYLLTLMYWLRTELGKPVEAVYGFYFCGSRCEHQHGFYVVGFIKLSAPTTLGECLEVDVYETTDTVDSNLPMNALIHFLKHGKRWSVSGEMLQDGIMKQERRIPSLYTLPTRLWEDNPDNRQLILHGTLSIVFIVSVAGLKQLLQEHFKKFKNNLSWDGFCRRVDTFVSEEGNESDDAKYYLKIRSKDTSLQPNPMGHMDDAWDMLSQNPSVSGTYPIRPFSGTDVGVALMRDRGVPLATVISNFAATALLPQFKRIMETASFLSNHLPHGDVLPHNLVYDDIKEEISLIDIDEGVRIRGSLLTRKNEYNNGDDDWYKALRYPNFFVEDANRYTTVQLIASFIYILKGGPNEDLDQECAQLLEEAERLGESLCNLDKTDDLMKSPQRLKKFNNWVDKLESMMNDILGHYDE